MDDLVSPYENKYLDGRSFESMDLSVLSPSEVAEISNHPLADDAFKLRCADYFEALIQKTLPLDSGGKLWMISDYYSSDAWRLALMRAAKSFQDGGDWDDLPDYDELMYIYDQCSESFVNDYLIDSSSRGGYLDFLSTGDPSRIHLRDGDPGYHFSYAGFEILGRVLEKGCVTDNQVKRISQRALFANDRIHVYKFLESPLLPAFVLDWLTHWGWGNARFSTAYAENHGIDFDKRWMQELILRHPHLSDDVRHALSGGDTLLELAGRVDTRPAVLHALAGLDDRDIVEVAYQNPSLSEKTIKESDFYIDWICYKYSGVFNYSRIFNDDTLMLARLMERDLSWKTIESLGRFPFLRAAVFLALLHQAQAERDMSGPRPLMPGDDTEGLEMDANHREQAVKVAKEILTFEHARIEHVRWAFRQIGSGSRFSSV